MDQTELRFAALERTARRQRYAIALLASTLAFAIVAGAAWPTSAPEVLKARRFEVVNDAGEALVILAQKDSAGLIATQTPKGQLLVTLSSTSDGSGIVAVANARGERLVELAGRSGDGTAAAAPTTGVISAFNGKGDVAVSILSSKGSGLVQAFNSRKNPAAMLGGVDDQGVIAVFDAAGKVRQTIPADK